MYKRRNSEEAALAPSIRLFISSTFIDMEEEREALKKRVFPHIQDLCEAHGISFFPIDLRWGISEDKQQTGEVATICLKEVDNCRPYFLGIIGNRYGTVVDDKRNNVWKEFKSLSRFFARSITELEIRYGCFSKNSPPLFAHFYFNQNPNNEFADNNPLLSDLISDIKEKTTYSTYDGIEDFVAKTTRELERLVYELSEKLGDSRSAKQDWFLLNNRAVSKSAANFSDIIDDNAFKGHPIMLYSPVANGKTNFLNHFVSEKECNKIIINLLADPSLWQGMKIIECILRGIEDLYPDVDGFKLINSEKSSDGELMIHLNDILAPPNTGETKVIYSFSEWLEKLTLPSPLIILINDIDQINRADLSFFLSFLPRKTSKEVQIILSTNDSRQSDTAKLKGFVSIDFKQDVNASDTFKTELRKHGKELSSSQLLTLSQNPVYHTVSSVITACRILISCSSFLKIDDLVKRLAGVKDANDFFSISMETLEFAETKFKDASLSALLFVSLSNYGLEEITLLSLLEKKYGINQMEWLEIGQFVRIFCSVYNDHFFVINNETRNKILEYGKNYGVAEMRVLLGNECEHHIWNVPLRGEKRKYLFEQILQYKEAKAFDKLYETVANIQKLDILCDVSWSVVRNAWLELLLATDYSITNTYKDFSSRVYEYIHKFASSGFDASVFNVHEDSLRPLNAKIEALYADLYLWRECADQTPIENKQFFLRFISEIGSHTIFLREEVRYFLSAFDQQMIAPEQLKSHVVRLLSGNNNDWEKAFLYQALYQYYARYDPYSVLHADNRDNAFTQAINSAFATGDTSFVGRITEILLLSKTNYTEGDLELAELSLGWTEQMADVPAYFSAIVLYSNICIKLGTRLAEAERFLKNALILAAKVHREQMIPSIVYMLLDIYKRENDLEGKKAILEYIRQKHSTMLERLSEQPRYSFETHDRFSNINSIVSMGRLLIKGKRFAEAERCFNVATDLISGLNYDNGCIPSIEGIAEFYLKLGDRSKAGAFLEQHLENAIKHRELLPLYQELLDEIPYMREGLEIEGFKLELFSALERDGICEAEDLLFSWLDTYPYVDFRELAKEFYELLSAKSDSELLQNDFSREEITDGYNDVIERYEL